MNREYYVLWYRLDDKDSYLIWFSSDEPSADGVLVDESGFVPTFNDIKALRIFAISNKIEVNKESPRLLNLDIVKNWLAKTDNKIEDYNPFLDALNLFEDISRSIIRGFIKNQYYEIYERIFWGCNIPAVTPEGESFTPTWTKNELKTIREIMSSGLKMFSNSLKPQ